MARTCVAAQHRLYMFYASFAPTAADSLCRRQNVAALINRGERLLLCAVRVFNVACEFAFSNDACTCHQHGASAYKIIQYQLIYAGVVVE